MALSFTRNEIPTLLNLGLIKVSLTERSDWIPPKPDDGIDAFGENQIHSRLYSSDFKSIDMGSSEFKENHTGMYNLMKFGWSYQPIFAHLKNEGLSTKGVFLIPQTRLDEIKYLDLNFSVAAAKKVLELFNEELPMKD